MAIVAFEVSAGPKSLGENLSDALDTSLTQLNRFDVIDRRRTRQILEEVRYALVGLTEGAKKLKTRNVDVLVTGTIHRNSATSYRIDAKFLDTSVGTNQAAAQEVAKGPEDFGEVARRLADTLAKRFPLQGSVRAAEPDRKGRHYIGLGQSSGVEVGQVGDIYRNNVLSDGTVAPIKAARFKVVELTGNAEVSIILVEGGYQPRVGDLVRFDLPVPVAPTPPVTTGSLMVAVNVAAATVFVDGRARGTAAPDSPLSVAGLEAGERTVVVRAPGYQDATRKVRILVSASTPVAVVLVPAKGSLLVTVNAVGATVLVDGQARGTAAPGIPLRVSDLEPGERTVVVRAPGYREAARGVAVRANESTPVGVTLVPALPATGSLSVAVNVAGATVLVDGQERGTAAPGRPLRVAGLEAGERTVVVRVAGCRDATYRVRVAASAGRTLNVTFASCVVPADGLASAIASAREGATLTLGAAEYRVGAILRIARSLTLVGAGAGRTRIISTAPDAALRFDGPGSLTVRNLSLEHEGPAAAEAMDIRGGTFLVENLRIAGAVLDRGSGNGGSAVAARGTARGTVRGTLAESNDKAAFSVGERAEVALERNTVRGTRIGDGISFADSSSGSASNNVVEQGARFGIAVGGQARVTLEGNVVRGNKDSGISYDGSARGVARNNTIEQNEKSGIFVGGNAAPTLENNVVRGNKLYGVRYSGSSRGVARNNIAERNEQAGISVVESAAPTLEGNTARDNMDSGISYYGSGGGIARNNAVERNVFHGIYVAQNAAPTLEGNTARDNKNSGIAYFDSAGGSARANTCENNVKFGIYVEATTRPTLTANVVRGNPEGDLLDLRR